MRREQRAGAVGTSPELPARPSVCRAAAQVLVLSEGAERTRNQGANRHE